MSVQFGRWNFDGRPAEQGYLEKVRAAIGPGGRDGGGEYLGDGVHVLYRSFRTTPESGREIQPEILRTGSVLTFDGRLDNPSDLARTIARTAERGATDSAVVAAGYESRGIESFSLFVGDWALTAWDPRDRSLVMAKDPIGTRPLYYSLTKDGITWSTLLEPLVELTGTRFALEEEYLAGWLSFYPAAHLTPYAGILSVPPSSFVRLRAGRCTTTRYWDFEPRERIRYGSDNEYEEHFRTVFRESVRRRLRSNSPVLAELSGGMDSSSVVCMADTILQSCPPGLGPLETVSYYDDSEPGWNERPYFTLIERQRGRVGCHIDVGSIEACEFGTGSTGFQAAPGSDGRTGEITKAVEAHMRSHGNRIILSGIGGDEFTGGVPTPVPELADLLTRGRFLTLALQLKEWALVKRRPWFHLLAETLGQFAPPVFASVPIPRKPAPWLEDRFVKRRAHALAGYPRRLRLCGPPPSFQANFETLDAMRREIGCAGSRSGQPCERRYPYLDRDFLEFLFAIPREQLVRPGERRSLMRRALRGIVPDAVLDRKRKAFIARSPRVSILEQANSVMAIGGEMVSVSLGIVNSQRLSEALEDARCGRPVAIVPLLRTLELESWLRQARAIVGEEPGNEFPGPPLARVAKHARPVSRERFNLS
ncbi:MAG: asparagine synthase-related protein [Candidatus Acidiferrales bacterium]